MYMRMVVHVLLVGSIFLMQVALIVILAIDAIARRDTYLGSVLVVLGPFAVYSFATVPRTTFLPPTAARGAFHACALMYTVVVPAATFAAARLLCVDPADTTPGLLRQSALLAYAERAASVAGLYLITGTTRLVYACCCHARMLNDDIELATLVGASAARAGAARRRPQRHADDDGDVELEDASVRADSLYADH